MSPIAPPVATTEYFQAPLWRVAVSLPLERTVLSFGDLGFHETQFLVGDFTASVSFIENIKRILSSQLTESAMRAVGIAPIADARYEQEHNSKPKKPTPTEIPVIPIRVRHLSLLN